MIRCYSLDIPLQHYQMTVWLGENPEPKNVSDFRRLEFFWNDVVQVLRLSSQESSSWNNIGLGFWQVERNWSRRETTEWSGGRGPVAPGVCGWDGLVARVFAAETNQSLACFFVKSFWGRHFPASVANSCKPMILVQENYIKTTSPRHVFVHPDFPPIQPSRVLTWDYGCRSFGKRWLKPYPVTMSSLTTRPCTSLGHEGTWDIWMMKSLRRILTKGIMTRVSALKKLLACAGCI